VTAGDARLAFATRLWAACDGLPLADCARDVLTAQAAHESGWGAAFAFRHGCNALNLTRTPTDPRPVVCGGDLEYLPDGTCRHISQRFAAYASVAECLSEFVLHWLRRERYERAAVQLRLGHAPEYAKELRDGGFYTAPLATYGKGLADALQAVRRMRADSARWLAAIEAARRAA
jgi:flagellum-specific peptidoglycan hydrolase FlgJ